MKSVGDTPTVFFQRRLHEISGSEEQEINQLRNRHSSHGSLLSGNYIYDPSSCC